MQKRDVANATPAIKIYKLDSRAAVRRYLAGTWSLSRRIIDHRAGLIGHLTGNAVFRPDARGFDYREKGTMRLGDYQGEASQAYRWDIDETGLLVIRFRDGRLFHELDLADGDMRVEHLCAADLYRGRFRLISDDCWLSRWRVTGPRKDQRILNRYQRLSSPA